jgi:ABC-2 type transport system permease protein
MALFSYIGIGLNSLSAHLHIEQIQGTLEAVLTTPVKIPTVLFALSAWRLLLATFDMFIYIAIGVFVFKINFSSANMLSVFIVLILTIASFSSLGIISASFIMVFKRGNPLSWVITATEGLVGGVYFPITVLPGWMQLLAKLFPITYAIRAMELAVYKGYTVIQLSKEIGFLLLFSTALLPLSLATFKYGLKKAKRQGSLTQY